MNDDAAEAMVRAGGGILLIYLGLCSLLSAPLPFVRRLWGSANAQRSLPS